MINEKIEIREDNSLISIHIPFITVVSIFQPDNFMETAIFIALRLHLVHQIQILLHMNIHGIIIGVDQ